MFPCPRGVGLFGFCEGVLSMFRPFLDAERTSVVVVVPVSGSAGPDTGARRSGVP